MKPSYLLSRVQDHNQTVLHIFSQAGVQCITSFSIFLCVDSLLMHTLMFQVDGVGYCNHIHSIQLPQNVNGWEEQENGEMDVTYDGSSNTTSVILIRRSVFADGGYN